MKIFKGAIEYLGSNGYISLQIPQYDDFDNPVSEMEEVPDEWISVINMNESSGKIIYAIGRKRGFSYLSQIGWKANKDIIKKAFDNSKIAQGTWGDFEHYVSQHFQELHNNTLYRIAKLKAKIIALEDTLQGD